METKQEETTGECFAADLAEALVKMLFQGQKNDNDTFQNDPVQDIAA